MQVTWEDVRAAMASEDRAGGAETKRKKKRALPAPQLAPPAEGKHGVNNPSTVCAPLGEAELKEAVARMEADQTRGKQPAATARVTRSSKTSRRPAKASSRA